MDGASLARKETHITNSKMSRSDRKARNAKVVAGIDKDLAPLGDPVQIGGEKLALSSLKSVFTDDSAAIDATDSARKAAQSAVLHEKDTKSRAAQAMKKLRTFLLGYYGAQAVTVLADFAMEPPKSTGTKTVAAKAVGVAKAKATRAARGTKGPVARKAVVGHVDEGAIKAAIETPAATPAPSGGATAAAPAAGPAAASTAATPPKPGATPQS